MYDLGMIAQNIVNEMNLPDDGARPTAYIMVVTSLVETVSEMMKELNRLGVEKIREVFNKGSKCLVAVLYFSSLTLV